VSTRPRYWCPPSGRIALDGGGFLIEPGRPFGPDQTLETFDEIDVHRCLVLLGEPGIGKTTELARAIATAGSLAYHVDLGEVADSEALRQRIVEAPEVVSWRKGDGELVLFLDSFDEALEERGVLGRSLIAELGQLPLDRLRLRIACRTADWPAGLTLRLAGLFDQPHEYELQPLTREDVLSAARDGGVDGDEFVDAVVGRDSGPLARVPLTLRFLLDSYVRGGALPARRAALYRDGCLELCREQNESRIETGRVGALGAEARLAIAERIGAGLVIGGRPAVRRRGHGSASNVAALAELDGGSEQTDNALVAVAGEITVDQRRLEETLATGLFTSRGGDVLGFAHQSYGEFLAARYLRRHRFDARRALNLLAQERGARQRIVPQLAGVAAWLADLDQEFLDWLIANEPEVALRADLDAADDGRKRTLVESLLTRADAGRLNEISHQALRKLAHAELAEQLAPWVSGGGFGPARRLAVEIVGQARVEELYEVLIEQALDDEEEMRIRVDAGWALWQAAPAELRARLKPLALAPPDADSDDDLKGVALLSVWPESLTVDELIGLLTPPKRENYLGAYGLFLGQELIPRLSDDDLVRMLAWVRDTGGVGHHRRFASLMDNVLAAAWLRLDVEAVLAAFAPAIAVLLGREHRIGAGSYRSDDLSQLVASDRPRRRLLVGRLLPGLIDGTLEPYYLVTIPLVDLDDLTWLLEQATTGSGDDDEKRTWARLINWVFRFPSTFEDAEAVLTVCAADPVIASENENLYACVALDSEIAAAGRERIARDREFLGQRLQREREQAEYDAASPTRMRAALDRVEAGVVEAYLAVDNELLFQPGRSIDRGGGDVRCLPTWQRARDDLRQRILVAAKRYLVEGPIDGQPLTVASHAGYRALRLLRAEGAAGGVPAHRIGSLVPAMLHHPLSGEEDRAAGGELLAFAAAEAGGAFVNAVLAYAEQEATQHGTIFFLGRLDPVPVGDVDEALCVAVHERRFATAALASVLEALLERGAPCAVSLALELLDGRAAGDDEMTLATSSAALLLSHNSQRETSERVLGAIADDAGFGRSVVERLAAGQAMRRERSIPALAHDLAAELFLFAARQFPWDDEGWSAHEVDSLRSSLLTSLRDAGTEAARAELERLQRELPELEWLARVLEQGEERTLAASWEPPDPRTVIALAAERSRRYVASGGQLLETIVDTLAAVQRDLDGDPSWANDLWRRSEGGSRPISEPEVSSWLKRQLGAKLTGERGVVFQREVQITQPQGPGLGDRTDVHVQAVVQHRDRAAEALTTIVEVKCCWNDDITDAIDTQLVERYLQPTATPYGIYLIVWFASERWDEYDGRRADCARRERATTMSALDERAEVLAADQGVQVRAVALDVRLT
jgi:hypothetical protein